MKKNIILLLAGILCSFGTAAQVDGAAGYYQDALLFSQTYTAGTARMQGLGSAQISLGGDVSAAHVNPAGLGFFRRSAVTFTPSIDFNSTEARYFDRLTEEFSTNFNVGQLGIVFHLPHEDEETDFKGGSFGITFTRTNNFNSSLYLDGFADESIIDAYIDQAWGIDVLADDTPLSLAYDQYLINPFDAVDNDTGQEFTGYDSFVSGVPRQVERTTTEGKQNQWDFSYGGNYKDLIYFGLSIGVSSVDYQQTSTYTESDFLDFDIPDTSLLALSTQNILDVEGYGLNGTLGLIVRPSDLFRVGLSAKTPTWYSLRETGSFDLLSEYYGIYYLEEEEPILLEEEYDIIEFTEDYRIRTPWKISLGTSFFVGKQGFLSADLDYIDYSSSKVRSIPSQFEENQSIRDLYKPAVNFRIGGEYRVGMMRLRAGYGLQGDPYKDSDINNSVRRISGGVGYRNKNIFVDASVVHSKFESTRTPYLYFDGTGPTAAVENRNLNVSVTVGFNF